MATATFWGQLIRNLREERAITQRGLSEVACVNRGTLRRIESGETTGDIAAIERCLHCLGYELEAMSFESLDEIRKREEAKASDPDARSLLAFQRLLSL